MNILTVCQGGNVRSVTLAYILKSKGVDTIACGVDWNSVATVEMLCKWADKILIAEDLIKAKIPTKYHKKVIDMEIGVDRWGQAQVPDLMALCMYRIREKIPDIATV